MKEGKDSDMTDSKLNDSIERLAQALGDVIAEAVSPQKSASIDRLPEHRGLNSDFEEKIIAMRNQDLLVLSQLKSAADALQRAVGKPGE